MHYIFVIHLIIALIGKVDSVGSVFSWCQGGYCQTHVSHFGLLKLSLWHFPPLAPGLVIYLSNISSFALGWQYLRCVLKNMHQSANFKKRRWALLRTTKISSFCKRRWLQHGFCQRQPLRNVHVKMIFLVHLNHQSFIKPCLWAAKQWANIPFLSMYWTFF
jgi:hypothetical protein